MISLNMRIDKTNIADHMASTEYHSKVKYLHFLIDKRQDQSSNLTKFELLAYDYLTEWYNARKHN